jgi:tight adherence protein C
VTALQLLTAGGLLFASGMVLAVLAVRPSPPSLAAALAQLNTTPTSAPISPAASTHVRLGWLPASVAALLDRHLGVSDADLAIIGWTRPQLAARKIGYAVLGLVAPSGLALVIILVAPGLVVFPVAAGLGLAVLGWLYPTMSVREAAAAARQEFRTNLESFLTLVAGERRARGSVEQALEEAAEISDSTPFVLMRRAIRRAALSGRKPWADLRDLADELDVPELRNLADIASVAADGGAVYNTLLASARTLRHTQLSDARAEANEASERMSRPLALLVAALTLFILIPFMFRMFGVAT